MGLWYIHIDMCVCMNINKAPFPISSLAKMSTIAN